MLSTPLSGALSPSALLVVEDLDPLRPHVVGPHAVVALRREVDDPVVEPRPLAAVEAPGARHLVAGRGAPRAWIRDLDPSELPARAHRHLEQPRAQVGIVARREAVEAAIAFVLGQVDPLFAGVDARRLVGEDAHRRPRDSRRRPGWVALPDLAGIVFLAGEPLSPRCRPARAVGEGAGEDPVGTLDSAVRAELDPRDPAGGRDRHLRVGDEDPAAVGPAVAAEGRERRLPVGREVVRVGNASARDDGAAAGDLPRAKALGQRDPVGVEGLQRPVGRLADLHRAVREGAHEERGPSASAPAEATPLFSSVLRSN